MHPRPSPSAHRGSRAARRANRRKGRGWRVATFVSIGVLVCVGAAVAAAALLNDNAKSEPTGRQSASRLETQPAEPTGVGAARGRSYRGARSDSGAAGRSATIFPSKKRTTRPESVTLPISAASRPSSARQ